MTFRRVVSEGLVLITPIVVTRVQLLGVAGGAVAFMHHGGFILRGSHVGVGRSRGKQTRCSWGGVMSNLIEPTDPAKQAI